MDKIKLTIGAILSAIGLLASGAGAYSSLSSDVSSLQEFRDNQKTTNTALMAEVRNTRQEAHDNAKEFNARLDVIIMHLQPRRK